MIIWCLVFARSTGVEDEIERPPGAVDRHGAARWKPTFWVWRLRAKIEVLSKKMGLYGGWRTCAGALVLLRSYGGQKLPTLEEGVISLDAVRTLLSSRNSPRRAQIWPTVSMLFLILKLCAVQGAPLFTILGSCYAASWLSVEIIYGLVGSGGLDDEYIEAVVNEIPRIEELVGRRVWFNIWGTLTAGLTFALMCFWLYRIWWLKPRNIIRIPFSTGWGMLNLQWITWLLKGEEDFRAAFGRLLLINSAGVFYYSTLEDFLWIESTSAISGVYAFFGMLMLLGVLGVSLYGAILWGMLVLAPFYVIFYNFRGKWVIAGANFIFFIGVLGIYVVLYDPEGTVKPDWLEWIGM